eukprot:Em0004g1494a
MAPISPESTNELWSHPQCSGTARDVGSLVGTGTHLPCGYIEQLRVCLKVLCNSQEWHPSPLVSLYTPTLWVHGTAQSLPQSALQLTRMAPISIGQLALDALDKVTFQRSVCSAVPELVATVMESICILFNTRPDWTSAKQACKSMCLWVRAIDLYAHVAKTVEPKRERLKTAEGELAKVMAQLQEKQKALSDIEAKIAELQAGFEKSVDEKDKLTKNMEQTQARLKRAAKLTTGLADEQRFDDDRECGGECVCGSSLCGIIWSLHQLLQREAPPADELMGFPLPGVEDPVSDDLSLEQADRWIRSMEGRNGLKVIKLTDPNYLRTLENAIRIGTPVLLEEVGEQLDPSLEPVLLKQTFVQGGRLLIRLGDSDVDYDKNFRFYMTTKMSNPHYLPELLSDVVKLEREDLEQQRKELIVDINKAKNELKVTFAQISKQLAEAEQTEVQITTAREKYSPVATRGSVMYFVVATLAEVDPMYQFSLKYFNQLFNLCIKNSPHSKDLEKRLEILLKSTTSTIYTNVARGLFEQHKLVFSFMLCADIMRQAGAISAADWNYFLRGAGGVDKERPAKPDVPWLTKTVWNTCCDMEDVLPAFKGLCKDLMSTPVYCKLGRWEVNVNPSNPGEYPKQDPPAPQPAQEGGEAPLITGHWDERLSSFQKLIMI